MKQAVEVIWIDADVFGGERQIKLLKKYRVQSSVEL